MSPKERQSGEEGEKGKGERQRGKIVYAFCQKEEKVKQGGKKFRAED